MLIIIIPITIFLVGFFLKIYLDGKQEAKESNQNKYLLNRMVIMNKNKFSKYQIQKAQQGIDEYNSNQLK